MSRCRFRGGDFLALVASMIASPAFADPLFLFGDLVVAPSVFTGTSATAAEGQTLPGGGMAVADGSYPNVFNNAKPDSSFGVTSPIFLDQLTTRGALVSSFNLTAAAAAQGVALTTSFPSKSEMALNLSTNGNALT